MEDLLAFPGHGNNVYWEGMNLRDYFAAQAMQSLIARGHTSQFVAEEAYRLADSMIVERDRRRKVGTP
jgi:hypothetical protein